MGVNATARVTGKSNNTVLKLLADTGEACALYQDRVMNANLSMRMGMRRFTRQTNAFSKKLENHMHAVSFYFMVYNFLKIHSSIKTTLAMEAGVVDFL